MTTILTALRAYIYGVLLGLDQLVNAIFCGSHKESICLRSAKAWKAGKTYGCVLCKVWDFFHKNHCKIVAWRNRVDDMPEKENTHISELSIAATLLFLVIGTILGPLAWYILMLVFFGGL